MPHEEVEKKFWSRKEANPEDEWGPFKDPYSEDELAEYRQAKSAETPAVEYTCDKCTARYTCVLVFDLYNTDGDCLLVK